MYLALYRKYRPRTFDDVISQSEIVTTLKNQIATGQNAHAYLFTGSRGTGKTSCAKILAMALNCKHPVDGNPCLECESCREIASGAATDIMEIDAASNNRVDDVHALQEQLSYTPVSCKYRIYILDEVHMMTTQAFNALLKTIEEPPSHVVFIFATTELHKVPATILSRCQRFEFRRIEIADSSERLMSIAGEEGFSLTREAADLISRISDGGMRDALSLFDRCIAVNINVTAEVVRSCAGVADNHSLYRFADMIAAKDIHGCIQLLEQLYMSGKDVARLMDEMSGVFRDLMLCKGAPGDTGLLSAMPGDYPEIQRIADLFSLGEILNSLTLIQECADGISRTRQRKTLAEMCFVKLCTGAAPAAQQQASYSAQPKSAPASAPAERKPMGSEYTPIPDEKLKPAHAANVSQLKAIFEKSAEKPVSSAEPEKKAVPAAPQPKPENVAPVKNSATQEIPLPEYNSKPAAPEAYDFVPPPEEPPEELPPQREFVPETAVSPVKQPQADIHQKQPESAVSAPAEPVSVKKAAPARTADKGKGAYEKLTSLTEEEWNNAVSRMMPMYANMFEDAKVCVNGDGVLEVVTGNIMLQGSAGSRQLEDELFHAFGKRVFAKIIPEEQLKAAGQEITAVEKLLQRAKQLNIEVIYKTKG